MVVKEIIISILRWSFVLLVIAGSFYQYKSDVLKESVDGLLDINKKLQQIGWVKKLGLYLISVIPKNFRDKVGQYLFLFDVILMVGSIFIGQKLLIIFGLRFLIQELLRADLLHFSLQNESSLKHIALGVGVCGLAFYLSQDFHTETKDMNKFQ